MNNLTKREAAELMGTAILIFAVVMGAGAGGALGMLGGMIGGGALGAASGLFFAYLLFHKISGGHFNPAVSIGMWLCGKMERAEAMRYVVMQVIGAIGGYILVYIIQIGLSDFEVWDLPGKGEEPIEVSRGYLGVLLLCTIGTALFVMLYLYLRGIKNEHFTDWWKTLIVSIGYGALNGFSLLGINVAIILVLVIPSLDGAGVDAIVGLLIALVGNALGAVVGGQMWRLVTGEGASLDELKGSMDEMRGGGDSPSSGGDDNPA